MPGFALAYSTSSFTFWTGTDAWTAIEVVLTQKMAIGTKSLLVSYGRLLIVISLSIIVLPLPSRMVWPSGSARLTSMTPSVPPAPPWFSTKTEPSGPRIFSAHWRPTMSFTPPAENGTTSLIGRSGYFACAKAGEGSAAEAAARPSHENSRRLIALFLIF